MDNKKHRAFVDNYFIHGLNGTDAYQATYPKASRDTARANAAKLLADTSISEEINLRMSELKMSADEVLTRFTDIARGSIEDFLTFKDGIKLPYLDLAKAQQSGKLHLIRKLKYTKDGTIEFELYPADNALEKLGRANNIFKDTTTNLNIDLSQLTNEQLERIANGEEPVNVLASQSQSGT